MTVDENLETFAGKRVENYDPDVGLTRPREVAYRARIDYDDFSDGSEICDLLRKLLDDPKAIELEALVIGAWDYESSVDSAHIVELLSGSANRLPSLRALFLGDIVCEEQEVSWIHQCDVTPLLVALPQLETFRVRGADALELGAIRHANLRHFAIESGGLPRRVIASVAAADLPRLEHLELWLGDDGYGYEGSDALAPILAGERFPALQHLGLMNAQDQDAVTAAIASSKLLGRIAVLDLSMGTLGDEGAKALLAAPATRRLQKLVIHHHYMSAEVVEQLRGLGIETDIGAPERDDDRYVAVSE